MTEINKKRQNKGWPAWILILPFIDFILLLRYLLQGKNVALFNSRGIIALEQHRIMMFTVGVLLMVAIPTLTLFFYTAWKYRESNTKTKLSSAGQQNKSLVVFMWLVPTTIMIVLATAMWSSTHRLVPQKVIASSEKPLTIQVISLRWKWLFLYPEQGVASINFVQLPLNRPVTFEMTADETPMSSFWIPNLGGQLYTMTSHVNRLNLMATTVGDYPGSSAEINGAGFAGMKFNARASSNQDFDSWVQSVKQSSDVLDTNAYQKLLTPSEYNPVAFYSSFNSTLYDNVITKYEGPEGHHH